MRSYSDFSNLGGGDQPWCFETCIYILYMQKYIQLRRGFLHGGDGDGDARQATSCGRGRERVDESEGGGGVAGEMSTVGGRESSGPGGDPVD